MADKWQEMLLRGDEVNPSSDRGKTYHLKEQKGHFVRQIQPYIDEGAGPENQRLRFQNVF